MYHIGDKLLLALLLLSQRLTHLVKGFGQLTDLIFPFNGKLLAKVSLGRPPRPTFANCLRGSKNGFPDPIHHQKENAEKQGADDQEDRNATAKHISNRCKGDVYIDEAD